LVYANYVNTSDEAISNIKKNTELVSQAGRKVDPDESLEKTKYWLCLATKPQSKSQFNDFL